jgi:hypothetical protein
MWPQSQMVSEWSQPIRLNSVNGNGSESAHCTIRVHESENSIESERRNIDKLKLNYSIFFLSFHKLSLQTFTIKILMMSITEFFSNSTTRNLITANSNHFLHLTNWDSPFEVTLALAKELRTHENFKNAEHNKKIN